MINIKLLLTVTIVNRLETVLFCPQLEDFTSVKLQFFWEVMDRKIGLAKKKGF